MEEAKSRTTRLGASSRPFWLTTPGSRVSIRHLGSLRFVVISRFNRIHFDKSFPRLPADGLARKLSYKLRDQRVHPGRRFDMTPLVHHVILSNTGGGRRHRRNLRRSRTRKAGGDLIRLLKISNGKQERRRWDELGQFPV